MMVLSCADSLRIDRRDRTVDGAPEVAVKRNRSRHRFGNQRLDQFLRPIRFGLAGRRHHLIEEAGAFYRSGRLLRR